MADFVEFLTHTRRYDSSPSASHDTTFPNVHQLEDQALTPKRKSHCLASCNAADAHG
jgi:hypothetical protein